MSGAAKVNSPTGTMRDIFTSKENKLNRYIKTLNEINQINVPE